MIFSSNPTRTATFPVLSLSKLFVAEHSIAVEGSEAQIMHGEKVLLSQIDTSLADRVDIHGNISNMVDTTNISAKRIIRAVQDIDYINFCIAKGIKLTRRETAMALAIKKLPHLAVLDGRPDLEPPTMDRALQSRDEYVDLGGKKRKRRATSSSSSSSSSSLTLTEEDSTDSSEHTSDDYSEIEKKDGTSAEHLEQNLAQSSFGKNLQILKKAAQHKQAARIKEIAGQQAAEERKKKERVIDFMSKQDLKVMKHRLTKSLATQLLKTTETTGASSSQARSARRVAAARRTSAHRTSTPRPPTPRPPTPASTTSSRRSPVRAGSRPSSSRRRSSSPRRSSSRRSTPDRRYTSTRRSTPDRHHSSTRRSTPDRTHRTRPERRSSDQPRSSPGRPRSTSDGHRSTGHDATRDQGRPRPNIVEHLGARPKTAEAVERQRRRREEDLFLPSSE